MAVEYCGVVGDSFAQHMLGRVKITVEEIHFMLYDKTIG